MPKQTTCVVNLSFEIFKYEYEFWSIVYFFVYNETFTFLFGLFHSITYTIYSLFYTHSNSSQLLLYTRRMNPEERIKFRIALKEETFKMNRIFTRKCVIELFDLFYHI